MSFASCAPALTKTTPVEDQVAKLKNLSDSFGSFKTSVEDALGEKVNATEIDALVTTKVNDKVGTAISNSSVVSTNKSDIATLKTEIATMKTQITALETWKATVGTGGTGTTGGTTTGQVAYTTSISPIQVWGNGTNQNFILTITNNSNQWKYVRPGLILSTPLPGAAINTGQVNIMMQCGSAMFSSTDFLYQPALSVTPRTEFDAAPYSGGEDTQGRLYIGPGQQKIASVSISVTSSPVTALWNVSVNLRVTQ